MMPRLKPFATSVMALWLAVVGVSAASADYQYFRLFGRFGWVSTSPPPPAGVLVCTMGGPATVAVDAAFAATPTVAGATGPLRFQVAYGMLPPGLSLDAASGKVAGAVAAPGAYSTLLGVVDAVGSTGLCPFAVTATGVSGFVVTGSPVLNGTVGGSYSATFSSVGGSPPYLFQASN